jgi:hypothetical protein
LSLRSSWDTQKDFVSKQKQNKTFQVLRLSRLEKDGLVFWFSLLIKALTIRAWILCASSPQLTIWSTRQGKFLSILICTCTSQLPISMIPACNLSTEIIKGECGTNFQSMPSAPLSLTQCLSRYSFHYSFFNIFCTLVHYLLYRSLQFSEVNNISNLQRRSRD